MVVRTHIVHVVWCILVFKGVLLLEINYTYVYCVICRLVLKYLQSDQNSMLEDFWTFYIKIFVECCTL